MSRRSATAAAEQPARRTLWLATDRPAWHSCFRMTATSRQPWTIRPRGAGLRLVLAAAVVAGSSACAERSGEEGTGTIAASLTGNGLREEARALRVVVFDLVTQGCVGPGVARPDLPPVATSGLVRTDVLQVTLSVPAGPRSIYVEAYRDSNGLDLFGTGCVEVVLGVGERRTVRIEIVSGGPGDADADADVPDDADADVPPDVPPDGEDVGPDVDVVEDVPDGIDVDVAPDVDEGEDAGDEGFEEADVEASDAPDVDLDADDVPDGVDAPDGTDELPDVVEDEGTDSGDVPVDADGADTGPAPPTLVISEIDYDMVGTDETEFVELYNYGADAVSCSGLELQFASEGATSGVVVYLTQPLTCASIGPGTFYVVGSSGLIDGPPALACPNELLAGAIQNGSTAYGDAVGLIWTGPGAPTRIDQVVYELPVTGWGEGSPAPADEGTFLNSLQRRPAGRDTDDNAADFFLLLPTPCGPPPP